MDTTRLTHLPAGHASPVEENARPALPPMPAFLLAAGIIGLGLFASVTPSPLYPTYQAAWDLPSLTLTLVYAIYAIGVLLALLLAGSVSDLVGRRPVLLIGLAGLIGATILSALAPDVVWLIAARAIQGVATGLALSAAGAALIELHPRRDPGAAGLANAVASTAGIAVGVLVASLLVEYDAAPLVLPYVAQTVLLTVAALGVALMPETVTRQRGMRLQIRRPRVPRAIRRPFAIAALTVTTSWSVGGLLFSLGPALGAQLFQTTDIIIASAPIVAMATAATASQLLFRRLAPRVAAAGGSIALAAGVTLIAAAAAIGSGPMLLIGATVSGIGFGAGFLGGLRLLTGAIPAADRASVMGAFYLVAYLALSIPAVVAGALVGAVGLAAAFELLGAPIAVLGVVTAAIAIRRNSQATASTTA